MLVDLFTQDKELASIILWDFPGNIILDRQYKVDTSEPGVKVYCFYALEYPDIKEFLDTCGGEYELREKDGKILGTRKQKTCSALKKVLFNPN